MNKKYMLLFFAAMTLMLFVTLAYGKDKNHIVLATIPVGDSPGGITVIPYYRPHYFEP